MQNEYFNDNKNNDKQQTIMKRIVLLGVILVLVLVFFLMYHFFVKKSHITCNYSTDKKMEYITLNGKQEVITTQKYIGCIPDYTMRYDIDLFDVFKYNNEDIFRFKKNEGVAIVIKEVESPTKCETSLNIDSITCHITEGDRTDIYYLSKDNKYYKIMVKKPSYYDDSDNIDSRINYMLNTFEANTRN